MSANGLAVGVEKCDDAVTYTLPKLLPERAQWWLVKGMTMIL